MIYDILTFPVLVILFPVIFIVLAIFTEASDRYGLSTFIVVLTIIGLQLFSKFHPFDFIVGNLVETVFIVIGWFLIGCIYATLKWWIYVNKIARDLRKRKDRQNLLVIPFKDSHGREIPLKVSDFKDKITGWIAFWAFSLLGTLLNDVLFEFADWLYNQIGTVLQKISDKAFKNI